ncbi:MAG: transposase [Ottowia sp.]
MCKPQAAKPLAVSSARYPGTIRLGNRFTYDAGKRVKGRKRHIAADTMGLLLAVVEHSAEAFRTG